jgi:nucleotide-binding universal stress UspA family protein
VNKVLNISKILVGIDGSEFSLRALEFSKDLACKYNSQIIAFTAFNNPYMYKILENKEKITILFQLKKKFENRRDYFRYIKKGKRRRNKLENKILRYKIIPRSGNDRISRKPRGKPYCNWL